MKPLRLMMEAFGPFAGEEVVDFAAADRARLFLIHGETGAGKSTLLDAICVALYGESAGAERTAEQMRSDLAAPDRLTRITLDFALGAERYRIERVPAQMRPMKRRKSGMTRQEPLATFWAIDEAGDVRRVIAERKVKEVNAAVQSLVGLDAAQFRQVVVLPQGQFRQVLVAPSGEREQILERLFGTAMQRRLVDALAERAATLEADLGASLAERQRVLVAHGVSRLEDLEATLSGWRRAATTLAAERDRSDAYRAEQARVLAEAEADQERRASLASAQADAERLAAEAAEIDVVAEALSRAEKAEPVAAAARAADDADVEAKRRDRTLADACGAFEHAREGASRATAQAARALDTQKENAGRREALGRLDKRLDAIAERNARARAVVEARRSLEARLRLASEAEKAANALTEERERLAAVVRAGQSSETDLARAQQIAREADEQLRGHEQCQKLAREFEAATRVADEAASTRAKRDAEVAAVAARVAAMFEARLRAGAATLAAKLAPGEACPVCGSTEHPSPARPEAGAGPTAKATEVARAEESAARRAATEAASDAARAHERREALQRQLEEARAGLQAPRDEARSRKDESAALTRDASARRDARERARVALDGLKARAEALSKQLEEAKAEAAKAEEAVTRAEAEADRARSSAGADDANALEAEAKRLRQAIADADEGADRAQRAVAAAESALAAATQAKTSAEAEAATQKEKASAAADALARALEASPFETLEAAREAARAPGFVAEARRQVATHRERAAAAAASIETLRAQVGERPQVDVDAACARSERAERIAEEARLRDMRLSERVARAEADLRALRAEGEAFAALEVRYGVARRLADLAQGKTDAKLNLPRFVLGAYLDDVIGQANLHLRRTTRGRYAMIRRESALDGRMKRGLDLDVLDHDTGEQRPASTLSGGEGFLAALALALGMADVVQAQAGGVRLDTVFVDEGFGTLDPESLDRAIDSLLSLRESGRMVGVISHVAALRERIDARLEVRRGEAGSTTRFVLPDVEPGR